MTSVALACLICFPNVQQYGFSIKKNLSHVFSQITIAILSQSLLVFASLIYRPLNILLRQFSFHSQSPIYRLNELDSNQRGYGLASDFLFSQPSALVLISLLYFIFFFHIRKANGFSSFPVCVAVFAFMASLPNARTPALAFILIASIVIVPSILATIISRLILYFRVSTRVLVISILTFFTGSGFVSSQSIKAKYLDSLSDLVGFFQGESSIDVIGNSNVVTLLFDSIINSLPENIIFGDGVTYDKLENFLQFIDPGFVRQYQYGGLFVLLLYLFMLILILRPILDVLVAYCGELPVSKLMIGGFLVFYYHKYQG